jgi:hypothetical protein
MVNYQRKNLIIEVELENKIGKTLEMDYPEDFFELFGTIKDNTFIEPD